MPDSDTLDRLARQVGESIERQDSDDPADRVLPDDSPVARRERED